MKKLLMYLCAVTLVFGIMGLSNTATAMPITFNYTGTAHTTNGFWAGQGTAVTGSYTYDTALGDSNGGGNTLNKFQSNVSGNSAFLSTWEMVFTLGSETRTITATGGVDNRIFTFIVNDRTLAPSGQTTDIFSFSTANASLALTGTAADAIVHDGTTTDDVAPTTAPDLTKFGINNFNGSWKDPFGAKDPTGMLLNNTNLLTFRLDSVTLAAPAVPEPATITLLGIGLAGLAGGAAMRKWKKKAADKS